MKFQSSIRKLLVLVSVLFLFGTALHAEESNQLTQTQQLADSQAKATSKDNGTMGSMHMDEMMNQAKATSKTI